MKIKQDGTRKSMWHKTCHKGSTQKIKAIVILAYVLTEVSGGFQPRCILQVGCLVRSAGPKPIRVSGSHWLFS